MRRPTREDCRLELGLKSQPGGTFHITDKRDYFPSVVSFPQGSRAGADTVCGCKQNHGSGQFTNIRTNQHIPATNPRVPFAFHITATNARPRPAAAMMDELSESWAGCTFSSTSRCSSCCCCCCSHRHAASHYRARSFLETLR